jgi:hypothetical protein
MEDRDVYLAKCKARALEYLKRQEVANAIASMATDIMQHPDLEGIAAKMMPLGLFYAMNNDYDGARRWIEGFR